MLDNVVLPVGGQVDVEIHQVVGKEPHQYTEQGNVEEHGQDWVLEFVHGDWEWVQVLSVDRIKL